MIDDCPGQTREFLGRSERDGRRRPMASVTISSPTEVLSAPVRSFISTGAQIWSPALEQGLLIAPRCRLIGKTSKVSANLPTARNLPLLRDDRHPELSSRWKCACQRTAESSCVSSSWDELAPQFSHARRGFRRLRAAQGQLDSTRQSMARPCASPEWDPTSSSLLPATG